MKKYPEIGVQVDEILLPRAGVDLQKWSVIACDQFTSQPDYWQRVQEIVGSSPSTYNLILPEVYLGTAQEESRIKSVQAAMRSTLEGSLLEPHPGFIYVERSVSGRTRHGLMLTLDLECYDFHTDSQTLIRATEGTILERLPPRIRIRENASLELPHILVLIDDPERSVIEPLKSEKSSLSVLYDTDLMLGSGHLSGWMVDSPSQEERIYAGLKRLADPARFYKKYGVSPNKGVLLFAVGDGNHSLATAKSIWEKIKTKVGPDHPARYALVEVENVHDEGLIFEPIHRVLFGVTGDGFQALKAYFSERLEVTPVSGPSDMVSSIQRAAQTSAEQTFGLVSGQHTMVVTIHKPESNLAVGTLQSFLDHWLEHGGFNRIDYVHGEDVVCQLGAQTSNLGFYLPVMNKSDLFKTVILDGALPRKTFSMGEAREKRFYMESRRIST